MIQARIRGGAVMNQTAKDAAEKYVLVVEDEIMIRLLLEDMLADLGYNIAAAVGRVDDAVKVARTGEFDVAILDVNLNGQTVSPVAEILEARGLPFVFATGYGERGLPERFSNRPTLQKPFQQENLGRILTQAFESMPA
jgi:CheY-like chemotaxis protein